MPFALVIVALFLIVAVSLWTMVVLAVVGRRVPAVLFTITSSAFGSLVALVPFLPGYLASQVPDESEDR